MLKLERFGPGILVSALLAHGVVAAPVAVDSPGVPLFFCRAGLNDFQKSKTALLTTEVKSADLQFGYGISSRLTVLESGELRIEVLNKATIVSTMVMKRGDTHFAMSAGGIEMSCYLKVSAPPY